MNKFVEIDNMRNRMIKGCAVECSGACGDCSRTGEPLALKGSLYLATGELEPESWAFDSGAKLYIIASDLDSEKTADAFKRVGEIYADAYCFAKGEYPLDESRLFARMAELKDEENISIKPAACAGFEGLRYIVSGDVCEAPTEESIVIVWAFDGGEPSVDEMLDYYEMAKRM